MLPGMKPYKTPPAYNWRSPGAILALATAPLILTVLFATALGWS